MKGDVEQGVATDAAERLASDDVILSFGLHNFPHPTTHRHRELRLFQTFWLMSYLLQCDSSYRQGLGDSDLCRRERSEGASLTSSQNMARFVDASTAPVLSFNSLGEI